MAKGSEMSDAKLGVDSLCGRCFWELDMQVFRLEMLLRGLAEYGSPSVQWRLSVEAAMTGGGVGGGRVESEEADSLWEWAELDFLTVTEEGWSEDPCFSRDRICKETRSRVGKYKQENVFIYFFQYSLLYLFLHKTAQTLKKKFKQVPFPAQIHSSLER